MSIISPFPNEIWEHIFSLASPQVLGISARVCRTWNECVQFEINRHKSAQYHLRSWLYEEAAFLFGTEEIQKKAGELLAKEREVASLQIPTMEERLEKNCGFFVGCVEHFADFFTTPTDSTICAYLDRRIKALIPEDAHLILDYPTDRPLNKYLLSAIPFVERKITFFPSPQFAQKIKKLHQKKIKQLFISKRILQYQNSRDAFLTALSKCAHLITLNVLVTSRLNPNDKDFCKAQGKQKVCTFGTLFNSLVALPNLMDLRVSDVNLSDEDAAALADYIKVRSIGSKPMFCSLEGNNHITSAGFRKIAKALSATSSGFSLFIHGLKVSAINQSGIQDLRRVAFFKRNVVIEIQDS